MLPQTSHGRRQRLRRNAEPNRGGDRRGRLRHLRGFQLWRHRMCRERPPANRQVPWSCAFTSANSGPRSRRVRRFRRPAENRHESRSKMRVRPVPFPQFAEEYFDCSPNEPLLPQPYSDIRKGSSSVPTPSFQWPVRQHWRRKLERSACESISGLRRSSRPVASAASSGRSAPGNGDFVSDALAGAPVVESTDFANQPSSRFGQTARVVRPGRID